jgi:hypothetical protein
VTHESTEMAPHAGVDSSGTTGGTPAFPVSGEMCLSARTPGICSNVTGLALIAASAFGSVHALLNSTAFEIARDLALLLLAVFWLGLAYWAYRDARRRLDDPLLIGTATLLALAVPYVGPVIYMLFRTPETLADVRSRDLELRMLEEHLGQQLLQCPVCRVEVEEAFVVCPVCTTRLKQPCAECGASLEPAWLACPYCTASTVTPVPELVTPDLDAALTAEATAIGEVTAHGRPRRRRSPSASGSG